MLLEMKSELSENDRQSALRMSKMINDVTADFKAYHFSIVDQITEEEDARAEQEILTEHELKVMNLIDRIGKIIEVPGSVGKKEDKGKIILRKRMDRVEKSYRAIKTEVDDVGAGVDVYTLQGYEDRVKNYQEELRGINGDLLSIDDADNLEESGTRLERLLCELSVSIKRLVGSKEEKPLPPTAIGSLGMSGIQLPKIEVPTFDGNLLNWRYFWEQFENTIHNKTQLTDSDKLTYLRDALKDGPARHVVSGLTQTAENYMEAIRCLQERYDRPRILHQAHVRKIQEATPLKTGSGQELRRLHDLLRQHTRALKTLEQHTLETYLTAAIELKLDDHTKLKWMEYSSDSETTPSYEELLKFLDIQARHHESVAHSVRSAPKVSPRTVYAALPETRCVACRKENHPLHNCGKFQRMTREERWEIVKKNGCCMNCLKVGHTAKKCRAPQSCRKCRKSHHTLLHINSNKPPEKSPLETVSTVTQVPQPKKRKQVLLMTCQAKVTGPNGNVARARIFLDPGAACSFITEGLAQKLKLPRRKDNSLIAGIAGVNATRTRGAVSFTVSDVRGKGKQINVLDALVLPKVTTDMPANPVDSISQWKHLTGLDLADPEFGTPGRVDVLLGADYYGEILRHGRRWGPRGTPFAQKTCFGWVLAGPLQFRGSRVAAHTCCLPPESDSSLKNFCEIEDNRIKQLILSPEKEPWSNTTSHCARRTATVGSLFRFRGNLESRRSGIKGERIGNRAVSAGGMLTPK